MDESEERRFWLKKNKTRKWWTLNTFLLNAFFFFFCRMERCDSGLLVLPAVSSGLGSIAGLEEISQVRLKEKKKGLWLHPIEKSTELRIMWVYKSWY